MSFDFDASVLRDFDRAVSLEWLETNGSGGWASSTVAGAHTRRYHGLLVAATEPPVGRTVLLSKLDETVSVGDGRFELGCNRFPGAVHPRGHERLLSFRRAVFPELVYDVGGVRLRKTVAAVHGENTTLVVYDAVGADRPVDLELRPFIAARDYHALARANDGIGAELEFARATLRCRPYAGGPQLFIRVPGSEFVHGPDWYYRFLYEVERYRGLDFEEDLWTPGVFRCRLEPGDVLGVLISTEPTDGRDARSLLRAERERREGLTAGCGDDAARRALVLAADQFIVRRGEDLRTIIAGYPWFGDWGRDTMIALPGLCLATGRHDDARKILQAFAGSVDRGMLPNRFPDYGERPEYNTVDATLWFFVASLAYLDGSGDEAFVRREILPVLREIVAWHVRGTRYGIRVAGDGLLWSGEPGVQLTWMDAKVGDWVVTPRAGFAVEVNALWCNALHILATLETRLGDRSKGRELDRRAAAAKERFGQVFWNDELGCLFDVVREQRADPTIRPNQIFALSLPLPLLSKDRARSVLDTVGRKLLTPVGLRSLDPDHPDYRPAYGGDPLSRDGAYHQGTVWAWLLGPYLTALLRYGEGDARRGARQIWERAVEHLGDGCVGSYSEIFDAEPPHLPRGAFAQAWSVAELLRIHGELDGHHES